jgi:hypothetical protein
MIFCAFLAEKKCGAIGEHYFHLLSSVDASAWMDGSMSV